MIIICLQVLNFVRVAVQSRKVNLLSMDRGIRDDILVYELPVDTKLQEFTISVSGERPQVVITDPDGKLSTHGFEPRSLDREPIALTPAQSITPILDSLCRFKCHLNRCCISVLRHVAQ